MADKYPRWNPYHYVHNNPVGLVDPSGMSAEESDWIPDKNTGNMIAETGDNAESLSKNWGYTLQQAQSFIDNSNVKLDGEGNVKVGETVKVSNRFTEIVSMQKYDSRMKEYSSSGEVQNCHGITCNGGGYYYEDGMDIDLEGYYNPVSKSEAIPLETVVRWKAYNIHDAGNFLWGNANRREGYLLKTLLWGANLNELLNFRWGDSVADMKAVISGYNHK